MDSNNTLPNLHLPPVNLNIKDEGDGKKIFDPLRKKFVTLTPEEHVRQHFTAWMRDYLHYPASMMANEVSLDLNDTKRRSDTVVFGRDGNPMIIVEYKAPDVKITQEVFDQIVRYNMVLRARYLIVSNGMQHFCCVIDYEGRRYNFIPRVPDYLDLFAPSSN